MPRTLSFTLPMTFALLMGGCRADKVDGGTGTIGSTTDAGTTGSTTSGTTSTTGPIDEDGDGYGADIDCDDSDAAVNPDADEICDRIDNNCDGSIDPDDATDAATWYADTDSDGFGDETATSNACSQPDGSLALPTDGRWDCDDSDTAVHPDAVEICDGIDNDCDGSIDPDDAADAATWYADADSDGFGDEAATSNACTQPDGTLGASKDGRWDCDDTDSTVFPGQGCDWVVHLRVPGTSSLYLVSADDNDIVIEEHGGSSTSLSLAAGNADGAETLTAGDYTLSGSTQFLALLASDSIGGDQVMKARGTDGSLLSTDLYTWADDYVVMMNPGSSDADVSLELWDGSAWSTTGTTTVGAGDTAQLSGSWGAHRITSTQPLLAYGMLLDNIENYFEYLPSTDGSLVGEDYLFMVPDLMGEVALTGLCIDDGGCLTELSTSAGVVSSQTLALGDTWSDLVDAATTYTLVTAGLVAMRDEATPYGFTAGDGTSMDGDLVPGSSGVDYDTEFILVTALGAATTYTDRRSDLILMGYTDGTTVTIDELSAGAWSTVDTVSLDAGTIDEWGTDLDPSRVLRVTASQPIHLLMTNASSEFAWSAFSDHFPG